MTPRASLLEHSVPSTIKEVTAELAVHVLQFYSFKHIEPPSAISSHRVLYPATECYIQLSGSAISREEYFTEFIVPFSSSEGEPTTSNLVLRPLKELP